VLSEQDVEAILPRDAIVQALSACGVKLASTRKTVAQLKELLNDAEVPRRTAGRSPAPAAGEPPVANGAQDKAVHKEAINAFRTAFIRSGRTTLTSDEMLANVRSVLNGSEGLPLPQAWCGPRTWRGPCGRYERPARPPMIRCSLARSTPAYQSVFATMMLVLWICSSWR
jgi:hypothetical protein